jgi:hypothetical protein
MSPEYLRELADMVDHEQLWRWAGMDHHKMTPEQKKRKDAGVALRRHATDLARMVEAFEAGKSVIATPMTAVGLSRAVRFIDPPADHQRLLKEQA